MKKVGDFDKTHVPISTEDHNHSVAATILLWTGEKDRLSVKKSPKGRMEGNEIALTKSRAKTFPENGTVSTKSFQP